jgi:GNAT superfamily N-acetyltransferase
MKETIFRPYRPTDIDSCLGIFDANCPKNFAPNERDEYQCFLDDVTADYEVCEADGQVLGAFGLFDNGEGRRRLNWILLDPNTQGMGIGSKIMARVIHLGAAAGVGTVDIAASHMSAPFFAKFGATIVLTTKDGWGEGMDKVDMHLGVR